MRILLADDDSDLLDVTTFVLRQDGFDVTAASDGLQALRRWRSQEPDLVLLDVKMPRVNGIEVCRKIRRVSRTPSILLTGSCDEEHIVQGFHSGADDYVTKPFRPRELTSRIHAVLRRTAKRAPEDLDTVLKVGPVCLEPATHRVVTDGQAAHLTPSEFQILHLLARHAGRVVSFDRLLETAWGDSSIEPALLKSHISHIRRKLDVPRGHPGDIDVVRGAGYILLAGPEARDGYGGARAPLATDDPAVTSLATPVRLRAELSA